MSDTLAVFFFNDTATTEIYTLSLHDALPICHDRASKMRTTFILKHPFQNDSNSAIFTNRRILFLKLGGKTKILTESISQDRKSTRLNSSHANISYAVFCLKKKKNRFILCYYT